VRLPENPPGRGADEHEFDAFYTASVGRLIGQLYAMTGDLAESQDVVQEGLRPGLGTPD
jgi:RNA polymerase sigma-70 factor (ECF subfamily)